MLATVAVFVNPLEAHIVRGRLETEGIPAFVTHEHHIWANWFISNALGGVKIQVNNSHVLDAKEVLENIDKGEYEVALEESQGQIDTTICPGCKSKNIIECRWNEKIALIVFWAFGIPLPYIQGQLECSACGFKWVSKDRNMYSIFARGYAIFLISIFYMLIIEGIFYICKMQGNANCY